MSDLEDYPAGDDGDAPDSESEHGSTADENDVHSSSEDGDDAGMQDNDNSDNDSDNSDRDGTEDEDGDNGDNGADDDDSDNESNQADENSASGGGEDIPEYEQLRLNNVKRNQERLLRLGLVKPEGEGVLGKKPPNKKRKRPSTGNNVPSGPRRKSSRSAAAKEVDYTMPSMSQFMKTDTDSKPAAKKEKPNNNKPRKAPLDKRLAREIYDEFKAIERRKKTVLKQAQVTMRSAETEKRHWERQFRKVAKREQRELENQQFREQLEEDRKIFGTSRFMFVNQLEGKIRKIHEHIQQFEYQKLAEAHNVESEIRRQEDKNKRKLIEALDVYTKSRKEMTRILNSYLNGRAPKDTTANRNSKRSKGNGNSNNRADGPPPPKKREKGDQTNENKGAPRIRIQMPQPANLLSSVTAQASFQVGSERNPTGAGEHSPDNANDEGAKTKKKRELNVGGWIEPNFAASIDRSWLEKDSPQKHFDLKTYVPQAGDTILYFPAGHIQFLREFPDHLITRSRITRWPLWERAKKEKLKTTKAQDQDDADEPEHVGEQSACSSQKSWWTEEWLEGVEGSLGNYPIICRVEKTVAEFPPDPNGKVIENNVLSFKKPDKAASNSLKKKTFLRLAVTLRPLSTVMPPSWSKKGLEEKHSLIPPPVFSAVIFPCDYLRPFLVPFAWGYISNHSLSILDQVVISQSRGGSKSGKVLSFSTLKGDFGNFRLEDKISAITHLINERQQNEAMSTLGTKGKGHASSIPDQEKCLVLKFFKVFLHDFNSPTDIESGEDCQAVDFMGFIRSTLPLWNSVAVLKDVHDSASISASPWEIKIKTAEEESQVEGADSLRVLMDNGLPQSLDNSLRIKLEFTIEDFLKKHPEAVHFREKVTDAHAACYSAAVPISMAFDRLLHRLKTRKSTHGNDCYYRSFEPLMVDLNSIHDNCLLYNDPESELVQLANDLIPEAKKLLSYVATCHMRDRAEKQKAEDEKKKLVMRQSRDGSGDAADIEKPQSKALNPFKEPFVGPLYRKWVQLTHPDASWRRDQPNAYPQWIPQAGDNIFYSRLLHAQFVKGHYKSLATNQILLPQFKHSAASEAQQCAKESCPAVDEGNEVSTELTDSLRSDWIVGTVSWVRAEFPRPRKALPKPSSGGEEIYFEDDTPVLALKVRFPSVEAGDKPKVIYWRPCAFACRREDSKTCFSENCKSCSVPLCTSFLRPAWANQFGLQVTTDVDVASSGLRGQPSGLEQAEASAIERCLCLLKRRCMNKLMPDFVGPNLTAEIINQGYAPQAAKIGRKTLPVFFDLFQAEADTSASIKAMTSGDVASIPVLKRVSFLPPWLPDGPRKKKATSTPLHESISVWPRLCLELILLRLKNGYYRQKASLHNDLVEGYVNSVLLCLAPLSQRKQNPISIKKLACVLSGKKYTAPQRSGAQVQPPKVASNALVATSKAQATAVPKLKTNGTKRRLPLRPAESKRSGVPGSTSLLNPSKSTKQMANVLVQGIVTSPIRPKVQGIVISPIQPQKGQTSVASSAQAPQNPSGASEQAKTTSPGKGPEKAGGKSMAKISLKIPPAATAGQEDQTSPKLAGKRKMEATIKKAAKKTKTEGGPVSKPKKKVAAKSVITLTDEEREIVSRLEETRRLYAVALVCITETTHVGYLSGLRTLTVAKDPIEKKMMPVDTPEQVQAEKAYNLLQSLLKALEKDEGWNGFTVPSAGAEGPSVIVKFSVNNELVLNEETVSLAQLSGVSSAVSASKESRPMLPPPPPGQGGSQGGRGETQQIQSQYQSEANQGETVLSSSSRHQGSVVPEKKMDQDPTEQTQPLPSPDQKQASPNETVPSNVRQHQDPVVPETKMDQDLTEETQQLPKQDQTPANHGGTLPSSQHQYQVAAEKKIHQDATGHTKQLPSQDENQANEGHVLPPSQNQDPSVPEKKFHQDSTGQTEQIPNQDQIHVNQGEEFPASRHQNPTVPEGSSQKDLLVAAPAGKTVVVKNGVKFEHSDFENNETLCHLLLAKPKRMRPCIRCQASRKSFFHCRAVKGHLNEDFDLCETFREGGGLERIFRILHQEPLASSPEDMASQSPVQHTGENDDTPGGTNDSGQQAHGSVDAQAGPRNVEGVKVEAPSDSAQKAEETTAAPLPGEITIDSTSGLSKTEGMTTGETKPSVDDKVAKDTDVDLKAMYQRAKSAFDEAKNVLAAARAYAEAPNLLDEDFIDYTFPVDPNDNKYIYCIVCGFSGDLLCCEGHGCSCVVHARCIALAEVPEEDWFCEKCCAKGKHKQLAGSTRDEEEVNAANAADGLEGNTLEKKLSPGEALASESKQDKNTSDLAVTVPSATSNESQKESAFTGPRPKAQPSAGTMPPLVLFDETKLETLTAEVDELFLSRTGHSRRGQNKSDDAGEGGADQDKKAPNNKEEKKPDSDAKPNVPAASSVPVAIVVGTKFVKKFGSFGYFEGEVTALPSEDHPFYKVLYPADNDREDLSEKQLRSLLSRKNKLRKKKGTKKTTGPLEPSSEGASAGCEANKGSPVLMDLVAGDSSKGIGLK